ncbi:Pituitary tumor-transforming gene 1 protein-interacting protein isoform X1 [Oopsacas minuta]|uniref:Pituitary tumor-transforming gene 1 protein-interacting protein isoform X1 n=1 Tax=Oopsacas minuta TaxID=111878 RepID=A0AAV7K6B7_9METZ|nr:Pituitary tumor-transforming gene 1 protein-interacting protein isoform X1 [Oopsacas minuta]KAI6656319.1 Pituitary tumor-transforming gene 1 protein-interacting protein isoform X1 [Oopsacas minuta]
MLVWLLIAVILSYNAHSYGVLALLEESSCQQLNTSCEECVKGLSGVNCYFCKGECLDLQGINSGVCTLEDINLGQCSLSALGLIVVISGAAFLVAVAGCATFCATIYCYCRFCRKKMRATHTQNRVDAEMSEMQERHAQRRSARTARGDELRRKYGLADEDDMSKYQRF